MYHVSAQGVDEPRITDKNDKCTSLLSPGISVLTSNSTEATRHLASSA